MPIAVGVGDHRDGTTFWAGTVAATVVSGRLPERQVHPNAIAKRDSVDNKPRGVTVGRCERVTFDAKHPESQAQIALPGRAEVLGCLVCEDGGIPGWRCRRSAHESQPQAQASAGTAGGWPTMTTSNMREQSGTRGWRNPRRRDVCPICGRVPTLVGGYVIGARHEFPGRGRWFSTSELRPLATEGGGSSAGRSGADMGWVVKRAHG
jgi:hypothetical protein